MNPSDRRATLKQVAAEAGVSLSTASLVFSGRGPVSEKTRNKVRAAADRLNYAGPDPVAANLRRGRSGVVGLVLMHSVRDALRDPYALAVVDGLAEVLDRIPVGLLLVSQPASDSEELTERLRNTAIDAVLFYPASPEMRPAMAYLNERGVPTISVDGSDLDEVSARVHIDGRGAIRLAAQHLYDLGHRRVAVLSLPSTLNAPSGIARPLGDVLAQTRYEVPRERLLGIADVFGDRVPTVDPRGIDVTDGADAVAALLDLPARERPTAVIAHSDLLAMGVVQAAAERGLDVPGDLSVTGFDGITIGWWAGELTSVVQPGSEKGRRVGALVKALIEGDDSVGTEVLLGTELRVGTSTAAPSTGPVERVTE